MATSMSIRDQSEMFNRVFPEAARTGESPAALPGALVLLIDVRVDVNLVRG